MVSIAVAVECIEWLCKVKGGKSVRHFESQPLLFSGQVVREENLMIAGDRLPASVRALSGGKREGEDEQPEEVIPQDRAAQLQLGEAEMSIQAHDSIQTSQAKGDSCLCVCCKVCERPS